MPWTGSKKMSFNMASVIFVSLVSKNFRLKISRLWWESGLDSIDVGVTEVYWLRYTTWRKMQGTEVLSRALGPSVLVLSGWCLRWKVRDRFWVKEIRFMFLTFFFCIPPCRHLAICVLEYSWLDIQFETPAQCSLIATTVRLSHISCWGKCSASKWYADMLSVRSMAIRTGDFSLKQNLDLKLNYGTSNPSTIRNQIDDRTIELKVYSV
jgi:hypothetical protein